MALHNASLVAVSLMKAAERGGEEERESELKGKASNLRQTHRRVTIKLNLNYM